MVADHARGFCSDRAVIGVADIRGHDWPWRYLDGANLARCVRSVALLSGLYLIIQAVLSFGLGGYLAGRIRAPISAAAREETEQADGVHGLGVWALAVVMGAALAALIGAASLNRTPSMRGPAQASAAEPLLSYELDRLFRAGRRAPNVDLSAERAEAGRILLTTSGHSGLSTDDRAYLIQQVGALTGLSAADAERRVDNVIVSAKTAIARSRRSTIILAFSVATADLAWRRGCMGRRVRRRTASRRCARAGMDGAIGCDRPTARSDGAVARRCGDCLRHDGAISRKNGSLISPDTSSAGSTR